MKKLALGAAMLLGACQTPYGEMGLMGGVHAQRIDNDTAMIQASGNGYTGGATIVQYVLRKAAEETLQDGYDLFQVVASSDQSRAGSFTMPGQANATTSYYGNTATTTATYSAPQTFNFVKPGAMVTIKMFHGEKTANAPANVYDAHQLLQFMTPRAK